MKSITYTAARENLAATINRVCEDNAPVIITRNRDQSVVMLSLAEYESLEETAHLLRSPANAKRLLRSIDQLERGKGVRKKLKLDTCIWSSRMMPGRIISTGRKLIRRHSGAFTNSSRRSCVIPIAESGNRSR